MNHFTLRVAIGLALLVPTTSAQQSGSKSDWLKRNSPRASVPHGAAAPSVNGNPVLWTSNLVGGSDNCATPDVLVGTGSFPFNNTLATTGTQGQTETVCLLFGNTAVLNDVWFRWTATFNGVARISTCGIGNSIDTKLAVYNGAGCPTGPAIGCNDDACATFESTVDVSVVLGQSYTIQLGLYPGNNPPAVPGAGQISINSITPPPEDNCATPVVIAGPGTFSYNNATATTGPQGQTESICNIFNNTAVRADVWYRWTSTFTGTARVETCGAGSGIDTKLAAYAGPNCPTTPALACSDDACPSFESTLVFPVTNGQQYMIQVGCYPGGNPPAVPGAGTFSIQPFVGLPNDECTGALPIVGAGPHGYDTTNATTGTVGQTNARCRIFNTTTIAADLWYRWTAPSSGWFALNTCVGGQHDLKVAVYAGGGCPSGEPLSCDDDACGTVGATARAAFLAVSGQQYLFQIGSYQGQLGGPGFFTVDPFTPAAGDDCAAPIVLTGNGPFNWDDTNATTGFAGQSEVLCNSELITYDLWYRWTSTCTGPVVVSLCNLTASDTKVAIYSGSACPSGSSLACNDDGCAIVGGPSEVTFNAVLGQNYVIQLGLWPGEVPGSGSFTLTPSCPPAVGTPFCFGDGSGTACPCANSGAAGNGCANSIVAAGANIAATGVASLTADTVVLRGSGMPNSSALYFQGTSQQNGGLGGTFGDGLRCAGGSVIRLKTVNNAAGASQYPGVGDPTVSVRGAVAAPATRTYQVWYRNAAAFCTVSTFNLSNGLQVAWQP
ncbi:MAG: hypothetical protein NTY35_17815 [Planctomycetota bacterium]|nr:hypothetical protein [Planctomycetota bacterium]